MFSLNINVDTKNTTKLFLNTINVYEREIRPIKGKKYAVKKSFST